MLEIDIACKRFHSLGGESSQADYVALKNLRLSLADGEFVCLIGPSGCGKSTLLNIINGLDQDYEGRVLVGGRVPGQSAVSTMFQNPRLMPWLSVIENVQLVMNDSEASENAALRLLDQVGLDKVVNHYPNQLSGGMQRRVALARAFANTPDLLLMDEPFVSLDVPTAQRLRDMLIDVWQQRKVGVLFVTHDLMEALTLSDRVAFLSPGPGTVVFTHPIGLTRPRSQIIINELHNELMRLHPDLLAGLIHEPVEGEIKK